MTVNYIDFQSADITMRHRTQNHRCVPSHYHDQNITLSNSHDVKYMNDYKSSKSGEKNVYISSCTVATRARNQTDTIKINFDHSGKMLPYPQNIKIKEDQFFFSCLKKKKCTNNVTHTAVGRGTYCINGNNQTGKFRSKFNIESCNVQGVLEETPPDLIQDSSNLCCIREYVENEIYNTKEDKKIFFLSLYTRE